MVTESDRTEYRLRQAYSYLQDADTALLLASASFRAIKWDTASGEMHGAADVVLAAQDAIEKYLTGMGIEL